MEINGLPLHPLAVHAAVVLAPLVALLALASLVPAWRDRLRWPLVVGAVVAIGAVALAFVSGNSFRNANEFFSTPPSQITRQIDHHHALALTLLRTSIGFGAVALLSGLLHPKDGPLRWLLGLLLAAGAVAVIVLVALTGDAGAKAVWGGFNG
jgi:formate hydrogenlyase subunit 3/multisubunit Na+/H+ antiporter MnhD subunit